MVWNRAGKSRRIRCTSKKFSGSSVHFTGIVGPCVGFSCGWPQINAASSETVLISANSAGVMETRNTSCTAFISSTFFEITELAPEQDREICPGSMPMRFRASICRRLMSARSSSFSLVHISSVSRKRSRIYP